VLPKDHPAEAAIFSQLVRGFFFNPNIQPREEFSKRLGAVRRLSELMGIDVTLSDDYDATLFSRDNSGRHLRELGKEERCRFCYSLRLEATARAARDGGFDLFSSSLLYSRYQDHELIKGLAQRVADETGVPFFYRDFRAGWSEGIKTSKEMGLYRQNYCGCVYSWIERFGPGTGRSKTGVR